MLQAPEALLAFPSKAESKCDLELFSDVEDDGDIEPPVVTPELLAALQRQVEFYLSDANLPTDKKLLKMVKKDCNGFVPVKLFVNFRKIRSMTKEPDVIVMALRSSKDLMLCPEEKMVRRMVPVPVYDIAAIQRRTVLVENLTPALTIEDVTQMFEPFGAITVVRICAKDGKSKLPGWLTNVRPSPTLPHAYIEYDEEEAALKAEALGNNQQHNLRVHRLTSLLHYLHGMRDDSNATSRRGSSKGSSVRSSRDTSPSAHRGFAAACGTRGGPGLRPGVCMSRTGSIASSNPFDSTRRYSSSSANTSAGGTSASGSHGGGRSSCGSGGGSDSISWVNLGTPPSGPAMLRQGSSSSEACSEGPWAAVCPTDTTPPVLAPGASVTSLQMMPTLADGITSSQLEDRKAVPAASRGSGGGVAPAKTGAYVPPARRSQDGNRNNSTAAGAAGPDLAAAAARNVAASRPHAHVAALPPTAATECAPQGPVSPILHRAPAAAAKRPPLSPVDVSSGGSLPTSRSPGSVPEGSPQLGSTSPSTLLRCSAAPYVPKPPLAFPPAKHAPLSLAASGGPALSAQAHASSPPPAPETVKSALSAMLADVIAAKQSTAGDAAAFAAAAAIAASQHLAAGRGPQPAIVNAAAVRAPLSPRHAAPLSTHVAPAAVKAAMAPKFAALIMQPVANQSAASAARQQGQRQQTGPEAGMPVSAPAPVTAAAGRLAPTTQQDRSAAAKAASAAAAAVAAAAAAAAGSGAAGPAKGGAAAEAKRCITDILAGITGTALAGAGTPAQPPHKAVVQQQQQAPKSLVGRQQPSAEDMARQAAAEAQSLLNSLAGKAPVLQGLVAAGGVGQQVSASTGRLSADATVEVARTDDKHAGVKGHGFVAVDNPMFEGVGGATAVVVAIRSSQQGINNSAELGLKVPCVKGEAELLAQKAGGVTRQVLSEGGVWGVVPVAASVGDDSGDESEEDGSDDGGEGGEAGAEVEGDAPKRRRKRGSRTRGRGGRPRRTTGSETGGGRSIGGGRSTGGGAISAAVTGRVLPRYPQRSAPGDSSWGSGDNDVPLGGTVTSALAEGDVARKVSGRRDYASWAAATPEYRAEAAAKTGVVVSSGPSPTQSPPRAARAPSPADEDWRVGRERSPVAPGAALLPAGKLSPPGYGGQADAGVHSMLGRGPDGTRGFSMGRGRPLKPPVAA